MANMKQDKTLPFKFVVEFDESGPQRSGDVSGYLPGIPETPPEDLPEPLISPNALKVLERRYLMKDAEGNVRETPRELYWRVARTIAAADGRYSPNANLESIARRFYEMMALRYFLPNSPTLMNAGRDLGQLSACFVLPIEDSMEGIFETVKHTALIHKSGGGTGFSFSRLRPKNSTVRSTAGTASGPVSFMRVFNSATETVKQGGTRRGANMGILRVDHPDILEFISCKVNDNTLNNFNISVALTDRFMEALQKGETYELISPVNREVVDRLDARMVFDKIVQNAWKNGDPGVIFIDEINRHNPTPAIGDIESTNPCGEQPLLPFESCNLGSLNLAVMVRNKEIDWELLRRIVQSAVHFLDNVIDCNKYPLVLIEEKSLTNRKIGLGIMGWADMLYQLKIPYDSPEAIELAERVMMYIQKEGWAKSLELGELRGPFPNWKQSKLGKPYRNATVTTIAPTGTIAMIAETSGGIEPNFSLVYIKKVMDGDELLYINRYFLKTAKEEGFYSDELMRDISQTNQMEDSEDIPDWVKKVFVTSHHIKPEWHVRMQAAFQKYTDNAVSKTINFPKESTPEDIRNAYLLAYELKCKGITVYRDGSREEQVLNLGTSVSKNKELADKDKPTTSPKGILSPRKRPTVTQGITERVKTGEGTLYVTINEDSEGLCELFASIGKSGGSEQAQSEAISRLISLSLRSGIDPEIIIKHLKGISGPYPVWDNGILIQSMPDAIGKVLERYLERKKPGKTAVKAENEAVIAVPSSDNSPSESSQKSMTICPDCGARSVVFADGCQVCRECAYSRCG
jgi:ribonucleoside-diphosphate reductase alpha chain